MKDIIDAGSSLSHFCCSFRRKTSRSNFLYLTFVFCIKIEKFIFRNNLGYREYYCFPAGFVHSTGNFSALHECFYHYFLTFGKCLFDSWLQFAFGFHFGNSKTASTYVRFYKAGVTNTFGYFFACNCLSGTQNY